MSFFSREVGREPAVRMAALRVGSVLEQNADGRLISLRRSDH
jgi:hypothetical protein